MKFLKENSYDIVKLFINQVGIAIFSIMLYSAVGSLSDNLAFEIAVSVFATIFYFALIYTASWDSGSSDKVRIDSGRLNAVKAKGAIISLIANIPNIIIAFAAIIGKLIVHLGGPEWADIIWLISNIIIRFILGMYLGIVRGIFSFLPSTDSLTYIFEGIGFLVLPLISVLVCHIGYTFGSKNFRILSLLGINQTGKKS
jgi:hypothetical protein